VKAFGKDERVLGWDLWNEPDNGNGGSYAAGEAPDKLQRVLVLLPQVFRWAREAGATQPLTSGVWKDGNWGTFEKLSAMEKIQIENSDVISFHSYEKPEEFGRRVKGLQNYHRPLICTEYMARGNGSTFEGTLPILKRENIGAINWGLVAGKSQTYLPVGFVGASVYGPRAGDLVSRDFPDGWRAVSQGRDGAYSAADEVGGVGTAGGLSLPR